MKNKKFSCTSNTVKLYKHLDVLESMQNGVVKPIMVHCMPTHRCQMDCVYCCFKNRVDKNLDFPFDNLKYAVSQFIELGIKGIELTGGGDPTLYPHINELMHFLHFNSLHIGVNTNAVDAQKIKRWDYCDWVRVSLNTLDYFDDIDIKCIIDSGTNVTFCYIWNQMSTIKTLERVIEICNTKEIPCRIAPDCITTLKNIDETVEMLKETLSKYPSDYVFLSDFNITTVRHNHQCYIHMIKPCLYTDGNVYACPSAELALENNYQVSQKTKVCDWKTIKTFYRSPEAIKPKTIDCSYCKYAKQQIVLEEVLTETTFNEFA